MSIVAPNRMNTLRFPFIRLPLMGLFDKAFPLESTLGLFEVYVPSRHGGRLTIGFGKEHKSDENILWVDAPDGTRTRMTDKRPVRIEIAPHARGDGIFRVYVSSPGGAFSIYAWFEEIGFARERSGEPLIPWNFWYFPFGHAVPGNLWQDSLLQPLQRYEKAFGVPGVVKWEAEHHSDPRSEKDPWVGHCHDCAGASILFERPPEEGVRHGGVHFTSEELKLLAAEYFGRFGSVKWLWSLPDEGGPKRGPFHEQRPHEDEQGFGRASVLGDFINMLRNHLRDGGHAIRMDLRDETGVDHRAVWNQAVYRYVIRYAQKHVDDMGLLDCEMTMNANDDVQPADAADSGMPAEVSDRRDGSRTPTPSGLGRDFRIVFRMRFDADGWMDPSSADNRWLWTKRVNLPPPGGTGTTMGLLTFAPRNAHRLIATRPHGSPNPGGDGNPRIRPDDVLKLLRLRSLPE